LSIDDLSAAIRKGTDTPAPGSSTDRTRRSSPAAGQLATPSNTPARNRPAGWTPDYLKDVAEARESVENERNDMRFWWRGAKAAGATAVIAVYAAGTNAVEVSRQSARCCRKYWRRCQQRRHQADLRSQRHDRQQCDDVKETLFIAFILVVIVIFIFSAEPPTHHPRRRSSDVLLLTFIVMRILNYSLDNLSLMALTLAIGFLVDDAICSSRTSSAEWRTTTRLQFVRRSTARGRSASRSSR